MKDNTIKDNTVKFTEEEMGVLLRIFENLSKGSDIIVNSIDSIEKSLEEM